MPRSQPNLVTVQPIWRGETVVCIASGPSLVREDVEVVRGKARVIAVNTNYQLAPWADVVYACDWSWWKRHHAAVSKLSAQKFSLHVRAHEKPADVQLLKDTGVKGLELDPSGLRNGKNSGYQAIGLAKHFGAARILLLGYDCQMAKGREYWHPPHAWSRPSPYQTWVKFYRTLTAPLQALGITVVNCSRATALDAFPRSTITVELSKDASCDLATAS